MTFRSRILMPFRSRMGMALVAAVIAAAPLALLSAAPAAASFTQCTNQELNICVHVQGTGLFVDYVSGWAKNNSVNGFTGLHIEIEGPAGRLKNCSSFTLGSGQTSPTCKWTRNGYVRAGNYCATLWQWDGSGYLNLGTPCVDVHR